jgi:hypothetical protein
MVPHFLLNHFLSADTLIESKSIPIFRLERSRWRGGRIPQYHPCFAAKARFAPSGS